MAEPLTKTDREAIAALGDEWAMRPWRMRYWPDRYEATVQALEAENAELKAELARLNAQADERWLRDLDEGFPRRQDEG